MRRRRYGEADPKYEAARQYDGKRALLIALDGIRGAPLVLYAIRLADAIGTVPVYDMPDPRYFKPGAAASLEQLQFAHAAARASWQARFLDAALDVSLAVIVCGWRLTTAAYGQAARLPRERIDEFVGWLTAPVVTFVIDTLPSGRRANAELDPRAREALLGSIEPDDGLVYRIAEGTEAALALGFMRSAIAPALVVRRKALVG